MTHRFQLTTPRLTLLGADEALLRADRRGRDALSLATGCAVAQNWPPEHHDHQVIDWVMACLPALAPGAPWRFYYIVCNEPRTLVGTCGINQAPDSDGGVELGYSVLEQFRCRGIATEAVGALMQAAFAAGAREVAAQTYPALLASRRVMEKCGMTQTGPGSEPGTVRYAKRLPPGR
jgi:[ribosomal protein S5]-alanine N-acetyltransferase